MADTHPLPQPAPDVMCQRFDDGAVLFSTRTELYYGLDRVGATVWELLAAERSLDQLCAAVRRRHPGGEEDAVRRDVARLLEELVREGLLVAPGRAHGPPPPASSADPAR